MNKFLVFLIQSSSINRNKESPPVHPVTGAEPRYITDGLPRPADGPEIQRQNTVHKDKSRPGGSGNLIR